ncbi:MAG: hypothetical protein VKJ64_02665 [Leptolyngbyaceae bacterium]|nr:hypothetical protein [Leptolyngbyaceae bacterium]
MVVRVLPCRGDRSHLHPNAIALPQLPLLSLPYTGNSLSEALRHRSLQLTPQTL